MKDFILIAPINGLKYKNVLPLFIKNKIRTGYTNFNRGMYFYVPEEYEFNDTYKFDREKDGKKSMRYPSICWLTTLPNNKHFEPTETYSPEKYPKYDNYEAIEVNDYRRIPKDYPGICGVPITFLDKLNTEEYEIVDKVGNARLNGKTLYDRLLIKKKNN